MIFHCDCNSFYASVELLSRPELRQKPVAVCGDPASRHGIILAKNEPAKAMGVKTAEAIWQAKRKCPDLVLLPPHRELYRKYYRIINTIYQRYTDRVEPLSLDEAYLDVTVNHYNMPSATIIASDIRRRIREATGLTASAGVSVNKFLAKIASDYNKPDGLTVVTGEEAEAFVEGLKIEQFWGVGKVTADRMHGMGIHTGADLKMRSEAELVWHFGKAGHTYYLNARAIDNREVTPDRVRKSVGCENTFFADIGEPEMLERELRATAEEVWRRAGRRDFYGRTVTLKIKYADFRQITRSHTFPGFVTEYGQFLDASLGLLSGVDLTYGKVRLLGLSIGNPADLEQPQCGQLEFDFPEE